MGGWVDGWMGGWVAGKAGLRIAYSNQKQDLFLNSCFITVPESSYPKTKLNKDFRKTSKIFEKNQF
jgi:hypothetical protein